MFVIKKVQLEQWINITHHHQHRKQIYTMTVQCFGVNRRYHRQPQRIVCQQPQKAINICENWSSSIKWTLNLLCGKWFTCLYHRRNYTEILAIENVSNTQFPFVFATNNKMFNFQKLNPSSPVTIRRFWFCYLCAYSVCFVRFVLWKQPTINYSLFQ